jgi:hypothetical protein
MLGCQNHNSVDAIGKVVESKNTIDSTGGIPTNVKEYLKNNFPGWIIPDTSDYIKCWWSFYERATIPYFATTDINDDNLADFAFILKNANSIRLVILLGSKNTFTHWVADDFAVNYKGKVNDIQFGMLVEPPSHIDCIVDNTKEFALDLKSNGFVLVDLEQKIKLYYCENNTIKLFKLR